MTAAMQRKVMSENLKDVRHLLGSHGFVRVDNEDGKLVPVSCGERLSLISIESFLEDKDAAIIWRGPKKVGAIQQFVADVKWGALDYLLIDSPPGTGDEHMTILDAIPDAKCVVVTTPQEISLADVRKALRRSPRQTGRVELPRRDPARSRHGRRRGQGTSHRIHARRHPGEGRIPQARRNRAGSDASLTQP